MKRVILSWVVLGGLLALFSVAAAARGPIVIQSDSDFTAENGVVAGTGTTDDPYVIAAAEITAGSEDAYGLRIENARASFVVRGTVIEGAPGTSATGVRIAFSNSGRLEGCTISGVAVGVEIVSSPGVVLRSCVISTSGLGLRVTGESAEQYNLDIDTSNLLNNKEIRYYYGLDGEAISDLDTTDLTIANSRRLTITGNQVVNGDGIRLIYVTESTVRDNVARRSSPLLTEHGLFLLHSSDNVVEANLLTNNRLAGLQLMLSSRNVVRNNDVEANDSGIRLVGADENQIIGNVVRANVSGILLSGGSNGNTLAENAIYHENTKQGIALEQADGNRIERNGILDSEQGITLGEEATGNVIESNTILKGAYGISLLGSYNWILKNLIAQESRGILCPETYARSVTRSNEIRGNVFADNGQHLYMNLDSMGNHIGENAFLGDASALVADNGTGNSWTIGGVGNFWGTVSVADANGDGVGDSPVVVYPSTAADAAPRATWTPVGAGLGVLGTLSSRSATVTNSSGGSFQMSILVADSGIERWIGFRGFPGAYIERFPGVLFQFTSEGQYQFTMATVLFNLDVGFFAADGTYAGGTTMQAESTDVYTAKSPFLYALELPEGSLARFGIADGSALILQ